MALSKCKASAAYTAHVLISGVEYVFTIRVTSEADAAGCKQLVNNVVDLFRGEADGVQFLASGTGEPGAMEVDTGTGEIDEKKSGKKSKAKGK